MNKSFGRLIRARLIAKILRKLAQRFVAYITDNIRLYVHSCKISRLRRFNFLLNRARAGSRNSQAVLCYRVRLFLRRYR